MDIVNVSRDIISQTFYASAADEAEAGNFAVFQSVHPVTGERYLTTVEQLTTWDDTRTIAVREHVGDGALWFRIFDADSYGVVRRLLSPFTLDVLLTPAGHLILGNEDLESVGQVKLGQWFVIDDGEVYTLPIVRPAFAQDTRRTPVRWQAAQD